MVLGDASPEYQGAVRGTVNYHPTGGPTTITIGQLQFIHPERTFPAEAGAARLRFDSPELHFAQLDPYDQKRLVRVLVVRVERSRFVERAKANEQFRITLEERLSGPKLEPLEHRGERNPGALSKIFEEARFSGDAATAVIDAEFDLVSYSGGRAGMVMLVTSQNQMASALIAKSKELQFEPAIEVTLTTALLADILLSWKNLAESIA